MSSQMYYTCRQYLNRAVRVTTLDGRCYEGIIVDVDSEYLYLQMTSPRRGQCTVSAFWGPGANILTLSLFTLLAIALI